MKILKVRNVKTPNRGTGKAAGIDFFVPEKDSLFVKSIVTGDLSGPHERIIIKPNSSVLIPSGIKARVPEGYALIAFNKSGVATKKELTKVAEVVDEDYQGEIHIHVANIGKSEQVILPGEKLIQFILLAQNYEQVEEVGTEGELFGDHSSERGTGGFGSTGTN